MPQHPILDRTERLRAAATRLQLDCLDTVWLGWDAYYRFLCPKGHIIVRAASKLLEIRKSCRECEIDQLTDRLRAAAQDADVIWLDQRWLGSTTNHRFRCQRGHTWERKGHQARKLCRCSQCGHEKRYDYGWTRLQHIAAERGGECLTSETGKGDGLYSFRCAQGHTFQMLGSRVLKGGWCTFCARAKGMAKGWKCLQEMCQSRGGVCLSVEFGGYDVRHRFRCGAGHEWETTFDIIAQGNWCRRCQLTPEPMILDTAQEQARRYGGSCLSTTVPKAGEPLLWACGAGHSWSSSLNRVLRGHWCAECLRSAQANFKQMQIANAQQALMASFESIQGVRGKRVQSKSLANGRKRYEEPSITEHPILDRSPELRSAATRLQLDCLDTQWAGVDARYRFVCTKGHISIRKLSLLPSLKKGCRECKIDQFTDQLRATAQHANVTWLDPRWLGSLSMHSFRCQHGHTWERAGARAMMSCRCPQCVHNRHDPRNWNPHGWARLKQIAVERGGECLTLECGTGQQSYSFRCALGHEFQAVGSGVLKGGWCKPCTREKKMQKGWLRLQEVCALAPVALKRTASQESIGG